MIKASPSEVAKLFMQSLRTTPRNAYQYGRLSGILARRRVSKPKFYADFIAAITTRLPEYHEQTKKFNEHPLLLQNMLDGLNSIRRN